MMIILSVFCLVENKDLKKIQTECSLTGGCNMLKGNLDRF